MCTKQDKNFHGSTFIRCHLSVAPNLKEEEKMQEEKDVTDALSEASEKADKFSIEEVYL